MNPGVVEQVSRLMRWTFNPNGRLLKRWDKIMLMALLYTVTVTPFEVGFLGINRRFSLQFVSNRLCGEAACARRAQGVVVDSRC